MSFIGTVGVVAQQGNQSVGGGCVSAPTNTSCATSSSGNYDDACIVFSLLTGSLGEDALDSNDGSGFSSGAADINMENSYNYQQMLSNNSGEIRFGFKAFMRNDTGDNAATSFSWTASDPEITTSTSAISSAGVGGTGITTQDGTGSLGIGSYATLTHNSGGRGYLMLEPGDEVALGLKAIATNACGSSNADPSVEPTIVID